MVTGTCDVSDDGRARTQTEKTNCVCVCTAKTSERRFRLGAVTSGLAESLADVAAEFVEESKLQVQLCQDQRTISPEQTKVATATSTRERRKEQIKDRSLETISNM